MLSLGETASLISSFYLRVAAKCKCRSRYQAYTSILLRRSSSLQPTNEIPNGQEGEWGVAMKWRGVGEPCDGSEMRGGGGGGGGVPLE